MIDWRKRFRDAGKWAAFGILMFGLSALMYHINERATGGRDSGVLFGTAFLATAVGLYFLCWAIGILLFGGRQGKMHYCPSCGAGIGAPPDPGKAITCPGCHRTITRKSWSDW